MLENKTKDIVRLCLSLDVKASKIYAELERLTDHEKLKSFWQTMSSEEESHVQFWKNFLAIMDQGSVPQIFEDEENIYSELDSINKKVDVLFSELKKNTSTISKMLLLAYRMEFYLLHPAFENLFFYAAHTELITPNPGDQYASHIRKFINAFNTYGIATPELELLGETVEKLWHENRSLARQNMLDPLTGILNRRGFFNSIKPLMNVAQRNGLYAGLLMIDIDDFKQINDSYEHQVGDKVLSNVATTLAKSMRRSDIIGRYGGEEFIVYLSSITPDSIFQIADKMRQSIESDKNELGISITISVGAVSSLLDKNIDRAVNELIEQADSCLYEAKRSGKNKVSVKKSNHS